MHSLLIRLPTWEVIVASSGGWEDERQQADVSAQGDYRSLSQPDKEFRDKGTGRGFPSLVCRCVYAHVCTHMQRPEGDARNQPPAICYLIH